MANDAETRRDGCTSTEKAGDKTGGSQVLMGARAQAAVERTTLNSRIPPGPRSTLTGVTASWPLLTPDRSRAPAKVPCTHGVQNRPDMLLSATQSLGDVKASSWSVLQEAEMSDPSEFHS